MNRAYLLGAKYNDFLHFHPFIYPLNKQHNQSKPQIPTGLRKKNTLPLKQIKAELGSDFLVLLYV